VIAFSRPNEEILVDSIPLTEVAGVDLMQDVDQHGNQSQRSLSELTVENIIDFANAFQIRTAQNGYNSGRKYVIKADSYDSMTLLTNGIPNFSKAAILRADARPIWTRLQDRIRKLYSSAPFQGVATFLILAVRTICFRL
jgi:hypothetical protein